MAARLTRLLVALVLSLAAVLPSSAAAAVVRPPSSQEIAASPVPDRGADPVYASSYFGARYYRADVGRFTTVDPVLNVNEAQSGVTVPTSSPTGSPSVQERVRALVGHAPEGIVQVALQQFEVGHVLWSARCPLVLDEVS
jgi:hypothetical protein